MGLNIILALPKSFTIFSLYVSETLNYWFFKDTIVALTFMYSIDESYSYNKFNMINSSKKYKSDMCCDQSFDSI